MASFEKEPENAASVQNRWRDNRHESGKRRV